MPTVNQTKKQIDDIVRGWITTSLIDDQRVAFQRRIGGGVIEVTFEGAAQVSIALKNRAYDEIYQQLVEARAYNAKMLDGALVQMMYRFSNGRIRNHRLAFFPSPHLEEFQNTPDIYLTETPNVDVVARNIVPFPLRFDYDAQGGGKQRGPHPRCHLTLGQYENCRIPVTAPMTPDRFADFIVRNFYDTAISPRNAILPSFGKSFPESILPPERKLVHVVAPT